MEQVQALLDIGHSVSVLVLHGFGRRKDYLSLKELNIDSDRVSLSVTSAIRFPNFMAHVSVIFEVDSFFAGRSLRRAIKELTRNSSDFDGCIVHGLRHCTYSSAIWDAATPNSIKLTLIHGIDPILMKCKTSLLQKYYRRCGAVINNFAVVGSFLFDHLEQVKIQADNLLIIPNGTHLMQEQQFQKQPIPSDSDFRDIVCVGNLTRIKGIDYAIKALAHISDLGYKDWKFTIVGDGPERDNLRSLALELNIYEKVEFVGRLPRQATLDRMGSCDLFCLPSWAEAFGIVYLEAMTRGRPIIGCNNCGAADFVTNGRDGILVAPQSVEALVSALCLLWREPSKLRNIAARGRQTSKNFSWKRNAETISRFLKVSDR